MDTKKKTIMRSECIMLAFLIVKLLVYYYLIDWTIYSLLYMIISACIILSIFRGFTGILRKHKAVIFSVFYIGISILMFADVMYFNYYNQTVSIAQLWQIKNVAKVPQSFAATFIPASIFLLLDIPITINCFKKHIKKDVSENSDSDIQSSRLGRYKSNRYRYVKYLAGIIIFVFIAVNPVDSVVIANTTGEEFFINHVGDIYVNTVGRLAKKEIDRKDVISIIDDNAPDTDSTDLKGIAKGRNVIMVQLEAFQNFLINASYNGVTLTPNLNELIGDNSLYFDNFYSNIGKGNTADAEFSALNSLYPVIEREVYTLYQDNTFDGLPWHLKRQGYSTFAVHGYEGDFWNRRNAYKGQGIDRYYAMEDLDDSDRIGLGISDISVYDQAVDIMKEQNKPFFSFIVSLTNHHPFEMDDALKEIPIKEEDEDSKFANYLQTAHYTDKAIGELIRKLKEEGLYDNSIIIFYGDHHGLNKDMDDNDIYMGRFLGKEYDYDEMLKVPLIIHIPGSGVTRTVSTVSGQIDIFPTIANLMDIEISDRYILGQDAVNAKEGFVAFTAYMLKGSFVTDGMMYEISREEIFESGRAWNPATGEEIDVEKARKYYERAIKLKTVSEQILEQNLIGSKN